MALNDIELVNSSIAGNVLAFEELVKRYEKKVFAVAFRMTGNKEDAADLTQEAFIKAYKALAQFRGEAAFQTWLYRIIANVCRDELRKKYKNTVFSLDNEVVLESGNLKREVADSAPGPDVFLVNKEFGETIQKAVDSLAIDYRVTLVMREIQGFSYEEISDILKCSIGTVKSRLSRARAAVKNIFLASGEHPPKQTRQIKVKGGA